MFRLAIDFVEMVHSWHMFNLLNKLANKLYPLDENGKIVDSRNPHK